MHRLFSRRWLLVLVALPLTVVLGAFASRVRPDYRVEQIFPTFDKSRIDYERFKKQFPFEDAHAIVSVEADDLFTPAGLARVDALERDLGKLPGVVDTQSIVTVRDVVTDGDALMMNHLFASTSPPPDELARGKKTATTDPLFRWDLATPDGRATIVLVTLTPDAAASDAARGAFYRAARGVLDDHAARARAAGAKQKLVLTGVPVLRSQFTELVNGDLGRLFPVALLVILVILYLTFRSFAEVAAAVVTILLSVVWTVGAMGVMHVPMHVLTQVTPIVVMIVSISDTVHIIAHVKDELRTGKPLREAVAHATAENAIPCLLTEVTIAGGFVALAANDISMIQQFGLVTAAGVMLTWVANVTVLPLALSVVSPRSSPAARARESAAARLFGRFIAFIERSITKRPKVVVAVAATIAVVCTAAGTRVGTEFYAVSDDLRVTDPIYKDLRYLESTFGGSVPLSIYVEPANGEHTPDAMLAPEAIALLDRLDADLERDYPDDIRTTHSLAKYVKKAHRLLAGDEIADKQPLPPTQRLAAQELLAIDDARALRDVVSFDRSSAAVAATLPDRGSTHATAVIRRLRKTCEEEERRTGYKITVTGIYGMGDAIYRNLVGGLLKSFGLSVLVSFGIFFLVLRSWRLALVALVPNLLPLVVTVGLMSVLGVDVKPSTVIIFSITLVIADDDTIQYLSRWRQEYVALVKAGHPSPHEEAALGVLRSTGLPMFVTACAVTAGFMALLGSKFLAVANLGLITGISLFAAVLTDLFLTPLLLMRLRPRVG